MCLLKYIKLHFSFASQSLKTLMEYKVDFLIGLSGFVVTQAIGIILIKIIFSNIPKLNGWNYNQVLFIYAFSQIPRGIDHLLSDNLWMLSRRIIVFGEFDKYLLKPINPLFYLLAEKYQTDAYGELIVGFCLICYSLSKLKFQITFSVSISLILITIFATAIYTSIKLICASLAFWTRNSFNILSVVYSLSDFAKYPSSIYPKSIRFIITFIIPFSFTAYFPVSSIFRMKNILITVGGTAVVTIILGVIAYRVWLKGISVYESSGT